MKKPLRVFSARWSYFYGRRRFLGTVLGYAAMAVFATASVSACSTGSPSTAPPSFSGGGATPSVSVSVAPSVTPSSAPSTAPPSATTPSPTPSSSPSSSPSASSFPSGAPGTGGGGT